MEFIYLAIISALSIVLIFFAVFIGLHYGSKTKKEEIIDLPNINPVKAIKKSIDTQKEEKQKEKEKIIEEINLQNIDNYDGTEIGQQEFPN